MFNYINGVLDGLPYNQGGSIKCTQGRAGSQPSLQMQIWATSTCFFVKYPICFMRSPHLFVFRFGFWIFSIWMWAGDFNFGWFWNSEPGFWILKFCRLCPRCWWIVVIFEERRSRWLIIASWRARGTLKAFKYINGVLDGLLQHRDL